MEQRDTVGKISSNLLVKELETRDPIEQMRESLTDYDKNLFERAAHDYHKYPSNYYVVVLTKKEPLMQNVLRNYFLTRSSCPTPEYDQTLYRVNKKTDDIEFMWTVPSRDTCRHLRHHAMEVVPEEQQLLKFVLELYDGTLFSIAKRLNGEVEDSPLLVS